MYNLLGIIEKNKCDIAVCSIRWFIEMPKKFVDIHYPVRTMNSIEATAALCYSDGIECYAWGKLFKKTLFTNCKFRKDRLFEDLDIMWKLFLISNSIAVSDQCDYVYRQRQGSILNSSFNNRKLILLKIMCEFEKVVIIDHPELVKAVKRRKVFSEFWLLFQCMSESNRNYEIINQLKKMIYRDGKEVIKDKRASRNDKIKIIILRLLGVRVYYWVYRIALMRKWK